MKLKKLFWNWSNAIKTFPVSHILLLAISVIWIWNIQWSFSDHFCYRILIALGFAFLLSCLWPIFQIHSRLKNRSTINRILQILSLILWWIYYYILTRVDNLFNATYSEWLLYFWVLVLAALSIPLLIALLHQQEQSKIRFSRESLIISIIFWWIAWSIVRWWIAWAFGSIEALFDVDIDSDWYWYIWVISDILLAWSFVFNYYLTLVENINDKKSEFKIQPSRIRRIFWSFIFLPLALVYLLIFWAYWIKILITQNWPSWIIVRLWIWYFSLWIISAYLIYPEKTKAHEIINKILYISFILIAFMMIWAIVQRINQYWITINRRFICAIIVFIIIYSLLSLIFSKKRLLVFISALSILALLALYWPLNATNISLKSQVKKLEELLSKENITLPLWEKSLENINEDSTYNIISIVDELTQKYNKDKIVDKIISYNYDNRHRYSTSSEIRNYLWLDTDVYSPYDSPKYYSYRQNSDEYDWIEIAWYSKLYKFGKYDMASNTIKLNFDNQEFTIDLWEYIPQLIEKAELYAKSDYTNEELEEIKKPALILDWENYRLILTWFYGRKHTPTQQFQLNNSEWYILIK